MNTQPVPHVDGFLGDIVICQAEGTTLLPAARDHLEPTASAGCDVRPVMFDRGGGNYQGRGRLLRPGQLCVRDP